MNIRSCQKFYTGTCNDEDWARCNNSERSIRIQSARSKAIDEHNCHALFREPRRGGGTSLQPSRNLWRRGRDPERMVGPMAFCFGCSISTKQLISHQFHWVCVNIVGFPVETGTLKNTKHTHTYQSYECKICLICHPSDLWHARSMPLEMPSKNHVMK